MKPAIGESFPTAGIDRFAVPECSVFNPGYRMLNMVSKEGMIHLYDVLRKGIV